MISRKSLMQSLCVVLCILFVLPVFALAQSIHPAPAQNDEYLFSALIAVKSEKESKALLISHRQLITGNLWDRLIEEADRSYDANDCPRSLLIYSIARQSAEEMNDKVRLAKTLNKIGFVNLSAGNYRSAREYAEQSLIIAETLKDKKLIASALFTIGTVSLWQGDHQDALDYLQKCLAAFKELNSTLYMVDTMTYMGQAYTATGNYIRAFDYYNQALEILEAISKISSE
jgi:tetratricopeptide (TPR) repeat protein